MAKEDFCFTYYDGDAARDKSHMTRLQRGAYDDIISAQRKRGHLSLEDIKRVLSKDFDECWPALEWILKTDDQGKYFIDWVDKSIEKMRVNSQKQKDKINARWNKNKPDQYQNDTTVLPQYNHSIDSVIPLEDGDGNGIEDEFKKGGAGETIPVGIVPDMLQKFKSSNTEYPIDQQKDFPALRSIADKILKWQKLTGDITGPANSNQIKLRWGELVPFIQAEPFFGGYSLYQIDKHFQSIVQKFNRHAKQGTSQVGKSFVPD
jgi:hypothetical protein